MAEKNKTFIKVTNRDIYNKLEAIDNRLGKVKGIQKAHTLAISIIVIILAAIVKALV